MSPRADKSVLSVVRLAPQEKRAELHMLSVKLMNQTTQSSHREEGATGR